MTNDGWSGAQLRRRRLSNSPFPRAMRAVDAGVIEETPPAARRRSWRRFLWALLALGVIAMTWAGWREADYRAAIREAETAGFSWSTSDDPWGHLQEGEWMLAWRLWTKPQRRLDVTPGVDFSRQVGLLQRLKPTQLMTYGCGDLRPLKGLPLVELGLFECPDLRTLNGLQEFPDLSELQIIDCPALENIDDLANLPELIYLRINNAARLRNIAALKGMPALTKIMIEDCPNFAGMDGLKEFPTLGELDISFCPALHDVDFLQKFEGYAVSLVSCEGLQNIDGLRNCVLTELAIRDCPKINQVDALAGLSDLRKLDLSGCANLENVDGLKTLTKLSFLDLEGAVKVAADSLEALQRALPQTHIVAPDGTQMPPSSPPAAE